ncbi:hypothetical protein D3C80_1518010 [compost metagenome]
MAGTAGTIPLLAAHQIPEGGHQYPGRRRHADAFRGGIGKDVFAGGRQGSTVVDDLATAQHVDITRTEPPSELGILLQGCFALDIVAALYLGRASHRQVFGYVDIQRTAPRELGAVLNRQIAIDVKLGGTTSHERDTSHAEIDVSIDDVGLASLERHASIIEKSNPLEYIGGILIGDCEVSPVDLHRTYVPTTSIDTTPITRRCT